MSMLDRIGTTTAKTGAKKSTKIAAVINDEMKADVDAVIQLKARIKADTAALGEKESGIIEVVRAQQDQHAFDGEFSKSFDVAGNTGSLTYMTSDRFSVPQEPEALSAIRTLLGTAKYEEFFKEDTKLSIKSAVLDNEPLLEQILTACTTAGLDLNGIFEKSVKVVAVDALDEKQYSLRAAKLAQFRTLVRQNKPALK